MLGQAMASSAFPQQRDVAMRRITIDLLAWGNIGDRRNRITVRVFRVEPCWLITGTRHPFSRIQAEQVSTRDLVQNAPHFVVRIRTDVGWGGPALRSTLEIEAQSKPDDTTYAGFERPDPASLDKGTFMHVRAVSEIPDFVRWPPVEYEAVPAVVPTRQVPGSYDQSSPTDSHIWLSAIQRAWSQLTRISAPTARLTIVSQAVV
jgi:hypothetical protein